MRPGLLISTAVAALIIGAVPATGAVPTTGRPSGWSLVAIPSPPGASMSNLQAVSCASFEACMAVGSYALNGTTSALAERWNGQAWTIVPVPSPKGASTTILYGVSCARVSVCEAVGQAITTGPTSVSERSVAAVWDGTAWKLQKVQAPAGPGTFAGLASVSCTGPAWCEAVGGFVGPNPNAQEQPLAEHWDGTAWTVQAAPNPHAENGSSLEGLSCPADNSCMAGGNFAYADVAQSIFAFHWDGGAWMQQAQPNPRGNLDNGESAVACPLRSWCTAVGFWSGLNGDSLPLTEVWAGQSWLRVPAPRPPGATTTLLAGVSCVTTTGCISVGSWSASAYDNPELTLAEQWDGTRWRVQATPNPSGGKISGLNGVSCASPNGGVACVAVGSNWDGTSTQVMAETLNG
jgi:hypothetical protein